MKNQLWLEEPSRPDGHAYLIQTATVGGSDTYRCVLDFMLGTGETPDRNCGRGQLHPYPLRRLGRLSLCGRRSPYRALLRRRLIRRFPCVHARVCHDTVQTLIESSH